jgi:DNA-directed RNA polymerase specialized sigma24 family protein
MVLNRHCKHHVRQQSVARTRPQQTPWDTKIEAALIDPQAEADLRRADLRHDIDAVLAQLPETDRRLCQAVMDHPTYEAARQLGICASTLYRALRQLRGRFVEAGISGAS